MLSVLSDAECANEYSHISYVEPLCPCEVLSE